MFGKDSATAAAENTRHPYQAGTLRYSLGGVIFVSFWLILGGNCFGLLAWQLVPTVLPLALKEFDASGATIGLVVGSIPAAMNFVMNPILSTGSDRLRSRWGRRRPYLIAATPFVAGFVILLGWMPQLAVWLEQQGWNGGIALDTLGVALLAVTAVLFQFFNLIVGSIYYYLFADVIPHRFLGRYMAAMNLVGTVLALFFNLYVLPQAVTHLAWGFTIVGVVYFVIFMLMCIFVREGGYPPPPELAVTGNLRKRLSGWIAAYFRQCYRHPLFLLFFFGNAMNTASMTCRNVFNLLFATRDLNMTVEQFGKVAAVGAAVSLGVIALTGYIMDRTHPLKVLIASGVPVIAANIWGYYFTTDYASFFVVGIVIVCVYAIQSVGQSPTFVALFPPDRYGQFSSANAMFTAVCLIFANYFGGLAIDWFGYRFIFIWDTVFTGLATLALLAVYRQWKKCGGPARYIPPETGE